MSAPPLARYRVTFTFTVILGKHQQFYIGPIKREFQTSSAISGVYSRSHKPFKQPTLEFRVLKFPGKRITKAAKTLALCLC
jgi:hypothetical protein